MIVRASSGGGANPDLISATQVTTQRYTGNWDYDAECFFLFASPSSNPSTKFFIIGHTSSQNVWMANSNANKFYNTQWSTLGWSATVTKRSFDVLANAALTNVQYVPLINYPTGYFS